MRRLAVTLAACALSAVAAHAAPPGPDWSMNATIIEACSCPMFCQCYFDTKPAAHPDMSMSGGEHDMHNHGGGAKHFCRFNNAYRVNAGRFGATKLDGVKFWAAGDLGGDFSTGMMDWIVIHFDPSVTKAQRDGVAEIMSRVYPVKWGSMSIGDDAPIVWEKTAGGAHATLGGGKLAEVALLQPGGRMSKAKPMVIENLQYWGAPRNDGFVLMGPNEVEAYRIGDKAFEFKGTNGFMITFDISSADVAPATH